MVQRHPAKGQKFFLKYPERASTKAILKQKNGKCCGNKGKGHLGKIFPV